MRAGLKNKNIMNKESINLLGEEIKYISLEIDKLNKRKEACQNTINAFTGDVGEIKIAVYEEKKPTKKHKPVYVPKPKISGEGEQKFGHYLLNIFKNNSTIVFPSAKLCQLMKEGIESGKCADTKKADLSAAVGSFLWNYVSRGILKKIEKSEGERSAGYQYNGSDKQTASPKDKVPELEEIDEAIIELVKKSKNISAQTICSGIRMSPDYLDISKNLNGSLMESVEASLHDLVYYNVLLKSGNEYSHNSKSSI